MNIEELINEKRNKANDDRDYFRQHDVNNLKKQKSKPKDNSDNVEIQEYKLRGGRSVTKQDA